MCLGNCNRNYNCKAQSNETRQVFIKPSSFLILPFQFQLVLLTIFLLFFNLFYSRFWWAFNFIFTSMTLILLIKGPMQGMNKFTGSSKQIFNINPKLNSSYNVTLSCCMHYLDLITIFDDFLIKFVRLFTLMHINIDNDQ